MKGPSRSQWRHSLLRKHLAPPRLGSHQSCSVTEKKWQLPSNGFQAVSLLHLQELLPGSEGGYTRTHLLISCDIMQCTHHVASSLKCCSDNVFALHQSLMTKNLKLYHENKLIPTSPPSSVLVWKAWLEMEKFNLGFFFFFFTFLTFSVFVFQNLGGEIRSPKELE